MQSVEQIARDGLRTIWKFPLHFSQATTVHVPAMAVPVFVGLDPASGNPAVWMELDPNAPQIDRQFRIYGTGHFIEGDGGFPSDLYVGSVIHGQFVWHIYEVRS